MTLSAAQLKTKTTVHLKTVKKILNESIKKAVKDANKAVTKALETNRLRGPRPLPQRAAPISVMKKPAAAPKSAPKMNVCQA